LGSEQIHFLFIRKVRWISKVAVQFAKFWILPKLGSEKWCQDRSRPRTRDYRATPSSRASQSL